MIFLKNTSIRKALRARQRGFLLNPYRFAAAGGGGASDPNFAFASCIIQGTSSIVDIKGHTVTLFDNAAIGTAYIPSGAIQFDGSSDKVVVAGDSTTGIFAPQAGAWCFECFITAATSGTNAYAVAFSTSNDTGNNDAMRLEFSASRGIDWYGYNGGASQLNYASFPTEGVEHHIFVSRTDASTHVTCIGVDGVIRARDTTFTNNIGAANTNLTLGYRPNGFDFKGSMRGIRFYKGAHVYTGALSDLYTIPTLPYPAS